MTRLGSQLRAFFEETTEPLTVEEVLARRTVVVGEKSTAGDVGRPPWWSGPRLAAAVGTLAVVLFVAVASLLAGPGPEVGGADSAEAARAAIEELYRALEAEDIEAIEAFFDESVAFNSYLGIDMVGAEAAAYHVRTIMIPMTVLEVGDPEQNEDGSFSIVVEVLADTHQVPWQELYHVVMDGARVVSIDHEGNIAAEPREDVFAPYMNP